MILLKKRVKYNYFSVVLPSILIGSSSAWEGPEEKAGIVHPT